MPSPSIQQLAETLHSLHRTTRVRRGDDKDFDDDDDDEDSGLHNHGSSNDVFGNGYSSGSNNNGGDDHLGSSPWVDRGGLGNGAVAGISVAAAVIFLAVISALLFFFLRRRRQLHRLQNQPYLYRKSSHDSDLELRSGSSSLRSRDNVVYAKYAGSNSFSSTVYARISSTNAQPLDTGDHSRLYRNYGSYGAIAPEHNFVPYDFVPCGPISCVACISCWPCDSSGCPRRSSVI